MPEKKSHDRRLTGYAGKPKGDLPGPDSGGALLALCTGILCGGVAMLLLIWLVKLL